MNPTTPSAGTGLAEIAVVLQALLLFIGGATGSFCRAVMSPTQETRSKRTLADVLIGGFMGVLLPVIQPVLPVPFKVSLDLSAYELMALAAVMAFVANWATTMAGWRLGIFKKEREP